jgi:hypothetical protein
MSNKYYQEHRDQRRAYQKYYNKKNNYNYNYYKNNKDKINYRKKMQKEAHSPNIIITTNQQPYSTQDFIVHFD